MRSAYQVEGANRRNVSKGPQVMRSSRTSEQRNLGNNPTAGQLGNSKPPPMLETCCDNCCVCGPGGSVESVSLESISFDIPFFGEKMRTKTRSRSEMHNYVTKNAIKCQRCDEGPKKYQMQPRYSTRTLYKRPSKTAHSKMKKRKSRAKADGSAEAYRNLCNDGETTREKYFRIFGGDEKRLNGKGPKPLAAVGPYERHQERNRPVSPIPEPEERNRPSARLKNEALYGPNTKYVICDDRTCGLGCGCAKSCRNHSIDPVTENQPKSHPDSDSVHFKTTCYNNDRHNGYEKLKGLNSKPDGNSIRNRKLNGRLTEDVSKFTFTRSADEPGLGTNTRKALVENLANGLQSNPKSRKKGIERANGLNDEGTKRRTLEMMCQKDRDSFKGRTKDADTLGSYGVLKPDEFNYRHYDNADDDESAVRRFTTKRIETDKSKSSKPGRLENAFTAEKPGPDKFQRKYRYEMKNAELVFSTGQRPACDNEIFQEDETEKEQYAATYDSHRYFESEPGEDESDSPTYKPVNPDKNGVQNRRKLDRVCRDFDTDERNSDVTAGTGFRSKRGYNVDHDFLRGPNAKQEAVGRLRETQPNGKYDLNRTGHTDPGHFGKQDERTQPFRTAAEYELPVENDAAYQRYKNKISETCDQIFKKYRSEMIKMNSDDIKRKSLTEKTLGNNNALHLGKNKKRTDGKTRYENPPLDESLGLGNTLDGLDSDFCEDVNADWMDAFKSDSEDSESDTERKETPKSRCSCSCNCHGGAAGNEVPYQIQVITEFHLRDSPESERDRRKYNASFYEESPEEPCVAESSSSTEFSSPFEEDDPGGFMTTDEPRTGCEKQGPDTEWAPHDEDTKEVGGRKADRWDRKQPDLSDSYALRQQRVQPVYHPTDRTKKYINVHAPSNKFL